MSKKIILLAVSVLCCTVSFGQSRSFNLGKWTELQKAILQELNRSYVDTLPVDRIERVGIDAMLEALDPYTVYIPEEENEDLELMLRRTYGGVGAVIYKPEIDGYVTINEPYQNSPAHKAGLVCGDEVMEIDGVSVIGLTTQECSDRMKGTPGTKLVLKVKKLRTGQVQDVNIVRERIHIPDLEYAGMLNDTTGYIYQSGFTQGIAQEVKEAVNNLKKQGMKQLVYDLRGNGGGILQEAVQIVGLFVPKGSLVVSAKGRLESEQQEYYTSSAPIDTQIPIIVMVDGGSASASEIVSGALQDYDRATIIGTRTYGKGLVQSIRPLPYNGQMKVTTAKYYTPSGRCVQAIDYSHRREDGSVGAIPDSLTNEFRTAGGRIVRDGGGITPDVEIPSDPYSRITVSLSYSGILEQYAVEFVKKHESIPAVKDFKLSDADYEDFIEYAKGREFDYRSSAKTYFDQMIRQLESDGLKDSMQEELDALNKAIDLDKETYLRLKKDEIVPLIEEEIVVRYYFQPAGIELRTRYDNQLHKALEAPRISLGA
ncbi:MAG: S41 family peptidase [Bacteroidales bacterium]|nr:S41 family peptidase [Bacteroidales bacterium]